MHAARREFDLLFARQVCRADAKANVRRAQCRGTRAQVFGKTTHPLDKLHELTLSLERVVRMSTKLRAVEVIGEVVIREGAVRLARRALHA